MSHFDRLAQTLSGSHLVDGHADGPDGHSASVPVAAVGIRGPRRLSAAASAAARHEASVNEKRHARSEALTKTYCQPRPADEPAAAAVSSVPYSSGELPVAMAAQSHAVQTQEPVGTYSQMSPEAYAAYVHGVHVANQQQAQLAQLAQLAQMQRAASTIARAAVDERKVDERKEAETETETAPDGRVKFLLFGLALGALVVILLSGNTWSNLRTRLAFAMLPTPALSGGLPRTAPAAPMAPMGTSSMTKIPEYEVGRLPPIAAPIAAVAAPAAPRVTVAAAPKKQPMPQQIHLPMQPAAAPETVANEPAPPVPPGLDTALNMKAFGELGKAFKTE
jgi:hypothetical protein